MCQHGQLPGTHKRGRDWSVPEEALETLGAGGGALGPVSAGSPPSGASPTGTSAQGAGP